MLKMMSFNVGVVLLLQMIAYSYQFARTCSGDYCDPNWTPFPNMVAALRGYNIRDGNPLADHGDPGFLNQIFVPTLRNSDSRYELDPSITASDLVFCQKKMTSQSFTTINSYRNFIQRSSKSGIDLQIGTETELEIGIEKGPVSAGAKKNIPPPFQRAWGDSSKFKELKQFFTEKQGIVSVSVGRCIMYEVLLNSYLLPKFTDSFKVALGELYGVRHGSTWTKQNAFRKFIRHFGTHFLIRTKMGAQFMYQTKYTQTARQSVNADQLQKCNYVKGAKFFGIQVEKDKSGCTDASKRKLEGLTRGSVVSEHITQGSRPLKDSEWSKQKFIPVPLRFTLSAITNLMSKRNIEYRNLKYRGQSINSFEIRKWFIPMYYDYCRVMGKNCDEKAGCGIDDSCPFSTTCNPSYKGRHSCSGWSTWQCGNEWRLYPVEKRVRRCYGCNGKSVDVRPQLVYNHGKSCLSKWSCQDYHTQWNKESHKLWYLDRHQLTKCPNGHALNKFYLRRSGHGDFRYNYRCCSVQVPTHTNIKKNFFTDVNGAGDSVYLDRQIVDCGNGFIGSLAMDREGNKIRYRYNCLTYKTSVQTRTCYQQSNGMTVDGGGNTVYLGRQVVECARKYNLVKFRLGRNRQHTKLTYRYTCCKTQ